MQAINPPPEHPSQALIGLLERQFQALQLSFKGFEYQLFVRETNSQKFNALGPVQKPTDAWTEFELVSNTIPIVKIAYNPVAPPDLIASILTGAQQILATQDTERRQSMELGVIQEIIHDLSHRPTIHAIASLLTSKLKTLLGVQQAFFFYAESPSQFVCLGHWKYTDRITFTIPSGAASARPFSDAIQKAHPGFPALTHWRPVIQVNREGKEEILGLLGLTERWQGSWEPAHEELLKTIALHTGPLITQAKRYENVLEIKTHYESERKPDPFIGKTPAVLEILKTIGRLAQHPRMPAILLRGETGTGKEMIARLIHEKGVRREFPLIIVNCGAIPRELVESELFGHEKGAFTDAKVQKKGKFELAHRGTLFLDEVGDLPLEAQVKLLRALQEKKIERIGGSYPIDVDVQVIAATHVDLEMLIRQKQFRKDLFYRLNGVPITLPALRDRIDDLNDLITFFIGKFRNEKTPADLAPYVTKECLGALRQYHWPGNIRELQNLMERMLILGKKPVRLEDLPPEITSPRQREVSPQMNSDLGQELSLLREKILKLEQRLSDTPAVRSEHFTDYEVEFLKTLRMHHFRVDASASDLGLSVFRVRDIFKGICYKAVSDTGFDQNEAAARIAGDRFLVSKVKKMIDTYLSNLGKYSNLSRTKKSSGAVSLTVYTNKLPLEYRPYVASLLNHLR